MLAVSDCNTDSDLFVDRVNFLQKSVRLTLVSNLMKVHRYNEDIYIPLPTHMTILFGFYAPLDLIVFTENFISTLPKIFLNFLKLFIFHH